MKPQKIYRFWFMFLILVLAVLACQGEGTPTSSGQPAIPQASSSSNNGLSQVERSNLISATVQIYALFNQNGELTPVWGGSGTILNKSGLILTNAHVAAPKTQGEADDPDALAVALVQSEDKPPVFSYLAEVRAADGYLDMAVIQIVSTIDGDSIDANSLDLPCVPLGNSDSVHVGDHINVFGFPTIGGETITYTDGNVSGFISEEQVGDRAWIKTDATISGGNSGGLAANDEAQIIGIPTIAASGAETENITDCRVVQDTNGDGQLTGQDTCIPIGGFINGIRPINLAEPLIKAALGGQAYTSSYGGEAVVSESSTGKERMSDIIWYTTDKDGSLTNPVTSYDYGVNALVATFDFSGFVNGEMWSEAWYQDGESIYTGQYVWDQGESGNYFTYVNTTDGNPFDEGTYHVEIFVDDDGGPLTQGDVVVGSGGAGMPSRPSQAGGVILSGIVYDADSNNGIAGAYVIVLKPGISYDEWLNNDRPENNAYSYSQTDSKGNYRIPDAVQRNTKYTVIASARGYYDQYGDDLVWTDEDPAKYELNIGLSK